jgi:hypothetical protein
MSDWSQRVPNFDEATGYPYRRPLCTYCLNSGWVVVETGTEPTDPEDFAKLQEAQRLRRKAKLNPLIVYGEAYAPCPHCDFGHEIEFPAPPKKGRPTRKPPFGPDGYWGEHGWLKEHLRPREPDGKPDMNVNRLEARTLAAKIAAIAEYVEPREQRAVARESAVSSERADAPESADHDESSESSDQSERAVVPESADQDERADESESAEK